MCIDCSIRPHNWNRYVRAESSEYILRLIVVDDSVPVYRPMYLNKDSVGFDLFTIRPVTLMPGTCTEVKFGLILDGPAWLPIYFYVTLTNRFLKMGLKVLNETVESTSNAEFSVYIQNLNPPFRLRDENDIHSGIIQTPPIEIESQESLVQVIPQIATFPKEMNKVSFATYRGCWETDTWLVHAPPKIMQKGDLGTFNVRQKDVALMVVERK